MGLLSLSRPSPTTPCPPRSRHTPALQRLPTPSSLSQVTLACLSTSPTPTQSPTTLSSTRPTLLPIASRPPTGSPTPPPTCILPVSILQPTLTQATGLCLNNMGAQVPC